MFPKTLPRAAVRRAIHNEKIRRHLSVQAPETEKASIKGKVFVRYIIMDCFSNIVRNGSQVSFFVAF